MQHEQDAVEGGLIAHCELACATFGGGSEGGDQGLQLQPQFFANGLSCHEGMKHNCFMRVSWAVVLATLRVLYFPFSETTPNSGGSMLRIDRALVLRIEPRKRVSTPAGFDLPSLAVGLPLSPSRRPKPPFGVLDSLAWGLAPHAAGAGGRPTAYGLWTPCSWA